MFSLSQDLRNHCINDGTAEGKNVAMSYELTRERERDDQWWWTGLATSPLSCYFAIRRLRACCPLSSSFFHRIRTVLRLQAIEPRKEGKIRELTRLVGKTWSIFSPHASHSLLRCSNSMILSPLFRHVLCSFFCWSSSSSTFLAPV